MNKTSDGSVFRVSVEPGVAIAVEICGPADGPIVIFGNSLAADRGMWDEVVERLVPFARIIRYDARGHGQSGVPIGPVKLEDLGRDVLKIMNHLGIDRAVFCGLSLGGLTGMWLGANASERFSGLVLANTAPSFPPPDMWKERAATARTSGICPLVQPTLDRWLTKRFQETKRERAAVIGKMIGSTSVEGYIALCGVLAGSDQKQSLSQIPCPVLVVVGEHDPSTPPARGKEIVSELSNAKLLTLDAAHLSPVEAPDTFAANLRDFVENVARA
jgi:3-oxoadipate enol-lactonase